LAWVDVAADTDSVELGSLDDVRAELVALEAEEAQVSAERRRLHQQIDHGFATETTRVRERELSARRRELHQRIDALREPLGLPLGPPRASTRETVPREKAGEGMFHELDRIDDPWERAVPAFANDSQRLER
jgi:hypothetical protein